MKSWFPRFPRGRSAAPSPLPTPGGADDLLTAEQFRALLEKDAAVMELFCLRAIPLLRGEARRRLAERGLGPQLEEDLVQDIIEGCLQDDLRALRKWDPLRGTLRVFLRLLAYRRVQDQLRRSRYGRSCEKLMEGAALANLATTELNQVLSAEERDFWTKFRARFITRAAPEQQRLYQNFYVDESGAEVVAAELKLSVETLYQRLSRLRKFMFELRDELLDEEAKERTPRA